MISNVKQNARLSENIHPQHLLLQGLSVKEHAAALSHEYKSVQFDFAAQQDRLPYPGILDVDDAALLFVFLVFEQNDLMSRVNGVAFLIITIAAAAVAFQVKRLDVCFRHVFGL